jgi:hypothetical protein
MPKNTDQKILGGVRMINYESFKETVVKKFLAHMPAEYADCKVRSYLVKKVNQNREAIVLWNEGISIAPNLYLDDMYEEYVKSGDLDTVLSKAAEKLCKHKKYIPELGQHPSQYLKLENVVFTLVNTEWNRDLLADVPHREFHDLSLIYRVVVNITDEGMSSIILRNEILELMGIVSEEQLYQVAMENTIRLFPLCISKLDDLMMELVGIIEKAPEIEIDELVDYKSGSGPRIFTISNNNRLNGSAVLLYNNVLQKIADNLANDIILLPSSINDLLLLPAGEIEPRTLEQMVLEVNQTVVDESERLSNHIYFFSRKQGNLQLVTTKTVDVVGMQ